MSGRRAAAAVAKLAAPPAPRKRAASTSTAAAHQSDAPPPAKRARPATPPDPPRDKAGRLVFKDRPDFGPRLTPAQVIRAGSFGGIYFNPFGGKKGIIKYKNGVPIDANEFPASWFEGLADRWYKGRRYDKAVNKYGVVAGQDQAYWEEKGWMCGPDKRGWFQWYCHWYCGRRCDDDDRQISRWRGVASDTGRWRVTLANKLARAGVGVEHAPRVSPVICQTLLHWCDELTADDVKRAEKKLRKEGKL